VAIGTSIFMIALGAIITFALDIRIGWLDLDVVGWVLMVAGVIGLLVTLTLFSGRRRTVVSAPTRERYITEEPRTRVEEEVDRPL
jgi:hypothetical protein